MTVEFSGVPIAMSLPNIRGRQPKKRGAHRHGVVRFTVLILIAGSPFLTAWPAPALERSGCRDPLYRAFDFWAGDWDVYDQDQPREKVARVVVELILGRCVLHEIYDAVDGHKGESFSIYDASRHTWHQTWVTDHGQLLTIEGGIREGAMVLKGSDRGSDGKSRLVRGTWHPAKDGVREVAVRSTDGGATWVPWFDLLFRPHTPERR
jgi:hypothetical protein